MLDRVQLSASECNAVVSAILECAQYVISRHLSLADQDELVCSYITKEVVIISCIYNTVLPNNVVKYKNVAAIDHAIVILCEFKLTVAIFRVLLTKHSIRFNRKFGLCCRLYLSLNRLSLNASHHWLIQIYIQLLLTF